MRTWYSNLCKKSHSPFNDFRIACRGLLHIFYCRQSYPSIINDMKKDHLMLWTLGGLGHEAEAYSTCRIRCPPKTSAPARIQWIHNWAARDGKCVKRSFQNLNDTYPMESHNRPSLHTDAFAAVPPSAHPKYDFAHTHKRAKTNIAWLPDRWSSQAAPPDGPIHL